MGFTISSEMLLARGAAVGAMVICFAVVLGAGRFSKDGGAASARTDPAPIFTSAPLAYAQAEYDAQVERSPGPMPVMNVSEHKVFEPESAPARAVAERFMAASTFEPAPPPLPATTLDATLLGVWAPDASSCSLRDFREGLLPTIINANGAWAGETFCSFKNAKRTGTGWQVVATCSNADERWTTPVHLKIKGDRLTWASKRGSQVYTRCAPGLRVTAVQ